MRKKLAALLVVGVALAGLCGCLGNARTSKSFTFDVETGDKIEVSLNTSGGYDLTSDVPFSILKNEEMISQGTFIFSEFYEQYLGAVDSDENAVVLEKGEKDGNEYLFWEYAGSEYNYAVLIDDSDTAVVIGNTISEESARECFERLDLSLEE